MTNANRLIVFVKAPRPGTVKTRLAEAIGAVAAAGAYRRLVEELLQNLRPLPKVELCYSPDSAGTEIVPWLREGWRCSKQGAGDLGQRLLAAFERAFADGANQVVVIGSDCPAVTTEDIGNAWRSLSSHDVVLGPAADGGYWLMGLREPHPEPFNNIPWSTPDVLSVTLKRIRRAELNVQLLRELYDVDTERDWREFLARRDGKGINA